MSYAALRLPNDGKPHTLQLLAVSTSGTRDKPNEHCMLSLIGFDQVAGMVYQTNPTYIGNDVSETLVLDAILCQLGLSVKMVDGRPVPIDYKDREAKIDAIVKVADGSKTFQVLQNATTYTEKVFNPASKTLEDVTKNGAETIYDPARF